MEHASVSRMSHPVAARLEQMLSALEMCHSTGIAHRDIKPENILLDRHFQLRMADFGLSSIMEVRRLVDVEKVVT